LHLARTARHLGVITERADVRKAEADSGDVKVRSIGQVEDIPAEEQTDPLSHLDCLDEAIVGAEVRVSTQGVALAALTPELDPTESSMRKCFCLGH